MAEHNPVMRIPYTSVSASFDGFGVAVQQHREQVISDDNQPLKLSGFAILMATPDPLTALARTIFANPLNGSEA